MGTSTDKNQALRLLNGLEQGGLRAAEGRILAEDLDPVLVHVIVRFLREVYPATEPAARPVLERVVELTNAYPGIVAQAKQVVPAGQAGSFDCALLFAGHALSPMVWSVSRTCQCELAPQFPGCRCLFRAATVRERTCKDRS